MGFVRLRKSDIVLEPEIVVFVAEKLMLVKVPGVVAWNVVVQLM